MEQTQGLCDEWPKNCADCDCFRDPLTAAYERRFAAAALDAVVPVLLNDLADQIDDERNERHSDNWNLAIEVAVEAVRAAAEGWNE